MEAWEGDNPAEFIKLEISPLDFACSINSNIDSLEEISTIIRHGKMNL